MDIIMVIVLAIILAGMFWIASSDNRDEKLRKETMEEFYRQYSELEQQPSKFIEYGRPIAVLILSIVLILIFLWL